MNSFEPKHHIVDFLFPLALFFVFAASAVMLILTASGAYRNTAAETEKNYNARTAMAYLTEKIRQGDENGAVFLDSFDGRDALAIRQAYNGASYTTYIYADEGALKELLIKDGTDATAASGKTILEVQSFEIEEVSPHLFRFRTEDTSWEPFTFFAGFKSEKGGAGQ